MAGRKKYIYQAVIKIGEEAKIKTFTSFDDLLSYLNNLFSFHVGRYRLEKDFSFFVTSKHLTDDEFKALQGTLKNDELF